MTDTLADIDAATGCQHCKGPLGDSPSDDFCGERCRTAWHAGRAIALTYSDQEAFRAFLTAGFTGMRESFAEFGLAIAQMQTHIAAALDRLSEAVPAARPDEPSDPPSIRKPS